jgi:hypothetical protein
VPRRGAVGIPLLVLVLAMLPYVGPSVVTTNTVSSSINDSGSPTSFFKTSDVQTGYLDPILLKHTGSTSSGMTKLGTARTDIDSSPISEIYLPAGAPANYYSGEGEGGYFLVGSGGSADFGVASGTISFWGKWDLVAPHGRFWGQDADFETRWTSNQLVLDWGSDGSLQGSKNNWEVDHWYFIAITWDQNTNYLAIFWGDETTIPVEDTSTSSWTGSVVGFHTENNIMNSISRLGAQVDGNIDDFRFYSTQRNLEEIQSDYLPCMTIADGNLVSHYKFENDLTDSVGTNDLQVVGSCSFSRDVPRTTDGWIGEQVKVTANDILRLYALNGTFETGNAGTNVDWIGDGQYHPDGWLARREVESQWGRQRASYVEDSDSYVLLENEGYSFGSTFRHYNGTYIYWYQNIDNSELNDLFYFSLDYNYIRGPIGTNFEDIFSLRFELLDGSTELWNWSIDLTNMTQRQVWFNTGPLLVNITDCPSSFEARVVLSVETVSSSVDIDETDPDLDGDATNGQFLTVYLNNLELSGFGELSCEQVDLSVTTIETGSIDFSNSGVALLNHSHWTDAIVPLIFSSNTSIEFDYSAEFSKMYRFYNSSATTKLDNIGTSYIIDYDSSVNITFYTYVQSSPEARNLGLVIYCPEDWENTSVEDPFGNPVSMISEVEVPVGGIDSVGWWKINIKGPNYAQSVKTQVRDGSVWEDIHILHSGESIRCTSEIGTTSSPVSSVSNLKITWYSPESTIWGTEFSGNASGSIVLGSKWTLSSLNATTGEWHVSVFWTNGTEVAYGYGFFEVHHLLNIIAQTPHIDAQLDEIFTAAIYLYDQDTGTPILSDATIVGNWSGAAIPFSPNLAKGWWEADVNSSLSGIGFFTMVVNATMPYHSKASYSITVEITTVTLLTIVGSQYIELDPEDTYNVTIRYMFLTGVGIDGANVSVLTFSDPQDGLLFTDGQPVPGESGNYTIEFTAKLSGTYFITLTATKPAHSLAATSFYIIVGAVPTEVDISGVPPPEVLFYNETCTVSLFYHTDDLYGIEDAIVNVTYNPVSVVEWIESVDGYYNISIRVPEVGTYAVYLRFSKFGFDYAVTSFVFEVIKVPTSISFQGVNGNYYEGRTYNFSIYYNSILGSGIVGAQLMPSAPIRDFFEISASSDGWYNFTLTPVSGAWNATFWISKVGFEEQVTSFILTTQLIPIELSSAHPLNSTYTQYADSLLTLSVCPLSSDTGDGINSAIVSYVLIDTSGVGDRIISQGYFIESLGLYSVNVTVPDIGLYLIRITIEKEHHALFSHEIVLSSVARPETVFATYIQAGLVGALGLLVCLASAMIGRRFYSSITTKRNLELLELKGRLEDAKNLIGFLIIQRKVGLSVYSKVIKGGFEETLLSSFISAISHFREEFSMDSPKWTAIPITEVITAVQSEELICVIITVESASTRQKIQLETLSREIGGLYDYNDSIVTPIYRTLSEEVIETFDKVFASYFDGPLFSRYVGAKKDLPERLAPIVFVFKTMKIDHGVTPDALIRELILLGFNERNAYRIVFEAIDNYHLIEAEKRAPFQIETDESL